MFSIASAFNPTQTAIGSNIHVWALRGFPLPVSITQFVLIKANAIAIDIANAHSDADSDLPRMALTSSAAHPLYHALRENITI